MLESSSCQCFLSTPVLQSVSSLSLYAEKGERSMVMGGLSMCWCCGLISDNLPPPPSPEVQQGAEVPNGILEGLHAFSRPFYFLTSLFSLAHHCFGLLYSFEVVCFISSSTKLISLWFNRYWKITYSLRWMIRCLLPW